MELYSNCIYNIAPIQCLTAETTNMNQISTLSELLQLSGSSYRIFDMGRTVTKLSKQTFEKVEQAMQPYPYPVQRQACIAIVFWQNNAATPFIWFVKMPLDERGLLNQAARNHFIAIILEALGKDLSQDPTEKQEELLKSNPYNFTPAQYKLAALNSIVKRDLKQKASQYYEHCQLYFSGKLGFDNWQGVGVQGLCDFASRIEQSDNQQSLLGAFKQLPNQVLAPLCSAMENQKLPINVLSHLCDLTHQELAKADVDQAKVANLLRALSACSANPLVVDLVSNVVEHEQVTDINVLLTISSRNWLAISNEKQLMAFLEKLVLNVEHDVFAGIFQDLIALPDIRPALMICLRSPERSNALVAAFGKIFTQVKGN